MKFFDSILYSLFSSFISYLFFIIYVQVIIVENTNNIRIISNSAKIFVNSVLDINVGIENNNKLTTIVADIHNVIYFFISIIFSLLEYSIYSIKYRVG